MGTVKRKRPATRGKTRGQATEEAPPADALLTDSDAIDQISGLLDSRPWNREAVEQIAALIRETGRDVAYRETGREVELSEDELYDDDAEGDEGWLYSDEDSDEPAQLVASAYARISRIAGTDDLLRCPSCAGDAEWAEVGSRIHCLFCGYEGPPTEASAPRGPSAKASAPDEREVDNARRAKQAVERGEEWEECGSCGGWHPADWFGDCRDDERRLPSHPEDVLGSATPEELAAASKPAAPRLRPPRPEWYDAFGPGGPPRPAGGATAMRYDSGFGTVDYTCDSCGSKAESKGKPAGWTESGKSHRCPACAGGAGSAAPRGMTPERLAAFKAYFTAWSGGFEPAEMTTEEISTFLDAALDASFDRDEAIEALRAWRMAGEEAWMAGKAP
jgi:hypothetical protein